MLFKILKKFYELCKQKLEGKEDTIMPLTVLYAMLSVSCITILVVFWGGNRDIPTIVSILMCIFIIPTIIFLIKWIIIKPLIGLYWFGWGIYIIYMKAKEEVMNERSVKIKKMLKSKEEK